MPDFEETFQRELSERLSAAFKRVEDDWLRDHLFGEGTGELPGILSAAPAPRAPRPITRTDISHLLNLFKVA